MFIGEERFNALHVEKKPADWRQAQRRIIDRMTAEGVNINNIESYGTRNFSDIIGGFGQIPAGLYADYMTVTRSGNEESVYFHIYGSDGKRLAHFRVLDTSPDGYAAAARCAGLFFELFNIYMTINDL